MKRANSRSSGNSSGMNRASSANSVRLASHSAAGLNRTYSTASTASRASSFASATSAGLPNLPPARYTHQLPTRLDSLLSSLNLRRGPHRRASFRRASRPLPPRRLASRPDLTSYVRNNYLPVPPDTTLAEKRDLLRQALAAVHDAVDAMCKLQTAGKYGLVGLLQYNLAQYAQTASRAAGQGVCSRVPLVARALEAARCRWTEATVSKTKGFMKTTYAYLLRAGLAGTAGVLVSAFVRDRLLTPLGLHRVRGLGKLLASHRRTLEAVMMGESPRGGLKGVLRDLPDLLSSAEIDAVIRAVHHIPFVLTTGNANATKRAAFADYLAAAPRSLAAALRRFLGLRDPAVLGVFELKAPPRG